MSPLLVPAIAEGVRRVLDAALPDPERRAAAELEVRKLEAEGTFSQRADQALALAQADTNKAEALAGAWRGGWRPFVGWVCGAALAVQFVLGPLGEWAAAIAGHPVPPLPKLDAVLWELLAAMLGIGGLRTVEKLKGRA